MPGYRRSRALWDEANRPNAPKMALVRAIMYELQPIQFRKLPDWRLRGYSLFRRFVKWGMKTVPSTARTIVMFVSTMSWKNWMMVAAVLFYYVAVRTIHELLDAGPIVMILTALVAIFTIGLSDNETTGGMSAYSVFNRGFQQLMGSVDVENLVNQHVGGGMAMAAAAGIQPPPQQRNQQHRLDENDDFPPARRAAGNNNHHNHGQDNNYENDDDDNNDAPDLDSHNANRARKSGKKSRRRDLQQRRDLQNQRRAAVEMGLGTGDDDTDVVVQRLIEEQLAAAAEGE